MAGVLHISWTPGDVEKFEPIYNQDKKETAGGPGRGEDWGTPLAVLQHICAWSSDTMYNVDVFKDEETAHDMVFAPGNLAEDLRTISTGKSLWAKLGVVTPSKRPEPAVANLRIVKVVPPLRTELTDKGGHRRPRT